MAKIMTLPESLRCVAEYIELREEVIDIPHTAPIWADLRRAAEEIEQLRLLCDIFVPAPEEMSGWDDPYGDEHDLNVVALACEYHGIEMPAHVRKAAEAAEEE